MTSHHFTRADLEDGLYEQTNRRMIIDAGIEALWERVKEAVRLGCAAGMSEVVLELRDAESLIVMAEAEYERR